MVAWDIVGLENYMAENRSNHSNGGSAMPKFTDPGKWYFVVDWDMGESRGCAPIDV